MLFDNKIQSESNTYEKGKTECIDHFDLKWQSMGFVSRFTDCHFAQANRFLG